MFRINLLLGVPLAICLSADMIDLKTPTSVHSNKDNNVSAFSQQLNSCVPIQDQHSTNLTANCNDVSFQLHFENYSEFSAIVDFDSKTCIGQVVLNISINDCLVTLSKADISGIPDGSLIVVNRANKNYVPGSRVLLTLSEDDIAIQEPLGRQFTMKSGCKLGRKNDYVHFDTRIRNSKPACKALISLDSSAKFYNSSFPLQGVNLTFFIVATIIICVCTALLILMLCLWRLNSLPGTRLVTPRTGRYAPKSIEDSFPSAYPVHFKPQEEPVNRHQTTTDPTAVPAIIVEKYESEEHRLKL